jgi:D-xylose transport system permease protein
VTAPDGPGREGLRDLDGGSWITPNLYLLAGSACSCSRPGGCGRRPGARRGASRRARAAGRGSAARRRVAGGVFTVRITQRTVYLLVLAALAAWVLRFTAIGRRLYATGGNAEAARLSGIAVNRYKVVAFVLNGAAARSSVCSTPRGWARSTPTACRASS